MEKSTQHLSKTDQKKLFEFAEMFKIMVRNNKDFAIFMVSLEGNITSWNSGAQLLTGYSSEDILGKKFTIFFTPEDILDKAPEAELYYAKLNGHFVTEQQIVTKSGTTFWCDCILDAIRNEEGKLIAYCKIMRDLTESKRLENMKDEFISLVSHELRTPLTAISGAINIMTQYSDKLPTNMRKMLQIAQDNNKRLIASINNILSVEKLEYDKIDIHFHKIDLHQVIKEIILENLDYVNRFDVQLQYEQPPCQILIYSNYTLLKEAAAHVLHNAIKFSPPKSTVIIVCQFKENHAEIRICDEGDGVPKAFEKLIYKKFSQAQKTSIRHHGGLGLGLAISRQIIEKLGGLLTFKSRAKKGTLFTLKFPIKPMIKSETKANKYDFADV